MKVFDIADHIIADYEAAGLDPTEYCLFQIANEAGIGGAGIADFNSTGIRKFAQANGATSMREIASEGQNDSRAVLYHLDNDTYAIDTNGDPVLFADESELRQQLREWAMERTPGIPVSDDNETHGLFGQCSEWEHLMWACYAPQSDVDGWLASWQRDADGR